MYCEFQISQNELPKIIQNLGLDEKLPYYDSKRIIKVNGTEPICDSKLLEELSKNFGIQQWVPIRHGFASTILIYNESTELGCLMLSIAYG